MTRDLDEYVLFLFGFMRPYKGEQALLFIKKDQWTPPQKKDTRHEWSVSPHCEYPVVFPQFSSSDSLLVILPYNLPSKGSCFQKCHPTLKMDDFWWNSIYKWMIWGYQILGKLHFPKSMCIHPSGRLRRCHSVEFEPAVSQHSRLQFEGKLVDVLHCQTCR